MTIFWPLRDIPLIKAFSFLRKGREIGFLNGEICEFLHENQRLK